MSLCTANRGLSAGCNSARRAHYSRWRERLVAEPEFEAIATSKELMNAVCLMCKVAAAHGVQVALVMVFNQYCIRHTYTS